MALIFDLDGVIIDSMPVHTEAWEIYLKRCGVQADKIVSRMHGKRNDDLVRDLFGDELSDEEVAAHGAAKEALYRQLMAPRLCRHLIPGIATFLERHQQTPIGLATNAEPLNAAFVLEGAGLKRYFRAIVDGYQVGRPKPFPDIYLRTAQLLGAAPEDCVIFEDSPTGVEAALAAGARVVGVQTTSTQLPAVDLMIRDFLDPSLESWLLQS